MQGDASIISLLNKQLTQELSSVDQYLLDSKLYADWGLLKLQQQFTHEMQDEQGHAEKLIERILFLQGVPDVNSRLPIHVGNNVKSMLENALNYELQVAGNLKQGIARCESVQDYVTRSILEQLLIDTEEDHIFWLETQLGLIDRIGIANYLQSQMHS